MQRLKRILAKVPLTREGLLWFLISGAMLVTGLLKGINLINLLACWMVILVFLNYRWAKPQLRRITGRRHFPEPAFAGTPFGLLLQVENPGPKPVFGVTVLDQGPRHRAARFYSLIPGGAGATQTVTLQIPVRGLYRLDPLELTTGYPLGLIHIARRMAEPAQLVVYPKLGELKIGLLRRFLAQHSPTLGQARAFPRRHPGAQTEFHGLRPFRAGDSPRWIHWRTTARRGELMVREFEDLPNENLIVIVDPGGAAHLERLLALAATICWNWSRQKGDRLALAIDGPTPSVLVGTTGNDLAFAMLEQLALTGPAPSNEPSRLLHALRDAELPPGPMLVLSARATELATTVAQTLHRSAAILNVARNEDETFFEWTPPGEAERETPKGGEP